FSRFGDCQRAHYTARARGLSCRGEGFCQPEPHPDVAACRGNQIPGQPCPEPWSLFGVVFYQQREPPPGRPPHPTFNARVFAYNESTAVGGLSFLPQRTSGGLL